MTHDLTKTSDEPSLGSENTEGQQGSMRDLRDHAKSRLVEAKENLSLAQQDLEETPPSNFHPHSVLERKGNTLKRLTKELRASSAPKLSIPVPSLPLSQEEK